MAKFINKLMEQGKKSIAERILYQALEIIQERTKEDPLKVFEKAVDNVKPIIEVKSRRVGGATYQVPTEVRPERRTALAIRWLIAYAQERTEKSMEEKLAAELMDAANNRGEQLKNGKMFIRWPRPTRPSPIIDGKNQSHSQIRRKNRRVPEIA